MKRSTGFGVSHALSGRGYIAKRNKTPLLARLYSSNTIYHVKRKNAGKVGFRKD